MDSWVDRASGWWAVVLCVVLMLALTLFGIVLRWFDHSFLWIDPLVRHLVFLAAFLGGVLATGRGRHIAIDLLGRQLKNQGQLHWYRLHQRVLALVCTLGTSWLAVASWPFISSEWQYGRPQFFGIHSGFLVSLIPFGLALLALRFFLQFLLPRE